MAHHPSQIITRQISSRGGSNQSPPTTPHVITGKMSPLAPGPRKHTQLAPFDGGNLPTGITSNQFHKEDGHPNTPTLTSTNKTMSRTTVPPIFRAKICFPGCKPHFRALWLVGGPRSPEHRGLVQKSREWKGDRVWVIKWGVMISMLVSQSIRMSWRKDMGYLTRRIGKCPGNSLKVATGVTRVQYSSSPPFFLLLWMEIAGK